jgi:general nucleoside transport system permease protein
MLDVLNIMLTPEFGFTVIRVVVPILFAALAAYIANSAGIANIAIEGMMLMAAFVGTVTSAFTQNAWIGLLAACLAGMVMAAILSYFTLILKTNNILGGIALNLFSSSFTVFLLFIITGSKGTSATLSARSLPKVTIPILADIPILGRIFSGHNVLAYIMFAAVILVYLMMYQTPLGLRMKAVGKDPHAAESVGVECYSDQDDCVVVEWFVGGVGRCLYVDGISFVLYSEYDGWSRVYRFGG